MQSTHLTLMKKLLQYGLALSLAIFLFWFLFKDRDPEVLLERMLEVDLVWVMLSIAIALLSHLHRAWRWTVALRPLGYKASVFQAFLAVMTGYLANLVLPRMGEITRCASFNRTSNIPVSESFGAVVTERVFDLIILLATTAVVVIVEFDRLGDFLKDFFSEKGEDYTKLVYLGLALGLIGVLSLLMLYFLRDHLKRLPFYEKMIVFLGGIRTGLMSFTNMKAKDKRAYLFHTLMIWVGYYFMSYVLFFAVPWTKELGIEAGFVVLIMGGLGMAVPVQGGLGTYHLFVSTSLLTFGVSKEVGLDFAILMHSSQTLMIIVTGLLSFIVLGLYPKAQTDAKT